MHALNVIIRRSKYEYKGRNECFNTEARISEYASVKKNIKNNIDFEDIFNTINISSQFTLSNINNKEI